MESKLIQLISRSEFAEIICNPESTVVRQKIGEMIIHPLIMEEVFNFELYYQMGYMPFV